MCGKQFTICRLRIFRFSYFIFIYLHCVVSTIYSSRLSIKILTVFLHTNTFSYTHTHTHHHTHHILHFHDFESLMCSCARMCRCVSFSFFFTSASLQQPKFVRRARCLTYNKCLWEKQISTLNSKLRKSQSSSSSRRYLSPPCVSLACVRDDNVRGKLRSM